MKETMTDCKVGTLIHFGSKKFLPKQMEPIQNREWIKPYGGLWCSPVNSEWGWKDWCKAEEFSSCDTSNSFQVKLHDWAKVLVIDNEEDLLKLYPKKYEFGEYDFERVAKEYDAIWLTVQGQDETRHSRPYNLYGWDCETVLIMNPECCYQI